MTHTPRPWVVVKREDEDEGTLVKHVGENDDVLVCETNVSWRYPLVNAANARLIAAAPDMLEVLKRIESLMDFDDTHSKLFDGLQNQMVQAIAKAEGR